MLQGGFDFGFLFVASLLMVCQTTHNGLVPSGLQGR